MNVYELRNIDTNWWVLFLTTTTRPTTTTTATLFCQSVYPAAIHQCCKQRNTITYHYDLRLSIMTFNLLWKKGWIKLFCFPWDRVRTPNRTLKRRTWKTSRQCPMPIQMYGCVCACTKMTMMKMYSFINCYQTKQQMRTFIFFSPVLLLPKHN